MKYKVTIFFWIIISIIFIAQYTEGFTLADKINHGALYIWNGETIVAGFLHSGLRHFLSNLFLGIILMLYIENRLGSKLVYILFLSGIIFGNIGFLLLTQKIYVVSVGASGGVWAMLGAMLIILFTRPTHILEKIFIIFCTVALFYDTATHTNVNYLAHYSAYITGAVIVVLSLIHIHKKDLAY